MATVRRAGFGSVFEVENEKIGIGTTGTANNTLQVFGQVDSSDAQVIGLSTLTSYEGFIDRSAKIGKAVVDKQSQSGLIGEEVVIEGDVSVSSGSTFTSSLNQLTVTNSFSVPTGDTSDRINCQTIGSMRFNEDLGTLEFFNGYNWNVVNSKIDSGNSGRGVFGGGWTGSNVALSQISYVNIMSLGDAVTFGDLVGNARSGPAPASSSTRGLFMGGGSPTRRNDIDYITIASEGDGIDFGNLTESIGFMGGTSNSTRGLRFGGSTPDKSDVIDYVEMSTLGDALDFGDITEVSSSCGGLGSPTRGFAFGGDNGSIKTSKIDVVTMSSKGNAVRFGELNRQTENCRGNIRSTTRGIIAGGRHAPATGTSLIEFLTMASEGNAVVFGELTAARPSAAGTSNKVRGIVYGGGISTPYINIIEYLTIATAGNGIDFGDATQTTNNAAGVSDCHGGLGEGGFY